MPRCRRANRGSRRPARGRRRNRSDAGTRSPPGARTTGRPGAPACPQGPARSPRRVPSCPWCNLLYVAAKRLRPDWSSAAATIVEGEALDVLQSLPDGCAGLVYVDPPFNTGGARAGLKTTATADATASRLGFAGRRYRVEQQTGPRYPDRFDDYLGW